MDKTLDLLTKSLKLNSELLCPSGTKLIIGKELEALVPLFERIPLPNSPDESLPDQIDDSHNSYKP